MKSNFVPYVLSKQIKQLGFNEECFGYYVDVEVANPFLVINRISDTQGGYYTLAPLWQQAWEFLLSKLDANIFFWGDGVGEIGGCGNQQFFRSWEESIDILIMIVESTIKK